MTTARQSFLNLITVFLQLSLDPETSGRPQPSIYACRAVVTNDFLYVKIRCCLAHHTSVICIQCDTEFLID